MGNLSDSEEEEKKKQNIVRKKREKIIKKRRLKQGNDKKRRKKRKISNEPDVIDRKLTENDDLSDFIKFNGYIHKLHDKEPGALPLDSPYLQSVTAFAASHHFLGTYPWPFPDDWC